MASYTSKAIKGAAIFFIISLFAGFLGYLVRLVFARYLTRADYGLFYAVFTFFAVLSVLRDLGFSQAMVKYIAEFNVRKRYDLIKGSILITFLSQLAISIILVIPVLIFSKQISIYFFHSEAANNVLLFLAIMFILMPIERMFTFAYGGFQRFDYNSLVELVRMSFVLAISFFAFMYMGSVLVPCLAYVVAHIIENAILFPLFLRTFPQFFKVKAVLSTGLFKKMFSFGVPVMIGLFGSLILTYTDTMAITYFRTLEEVALYQIAMPTSKLILYFTTAICTVILPMSSELWARKLKDKISLGINLLYKYSFMAILPLVLLMLSFPEVIIKLFFGQRYVAAAVALQIMSLAALAYTFCYINGNVLSGIGKPKENMKITLIAAVFNLIADIILVNIIGINGAAIATLAGYCIILVLTGIEIKKALDVKIPLFVWFKNIVAGVVFIGLTYYLKYSITRFTDLVEMIIVGCIGFALYALLLFMLKVIDIKEIVSIAKYALRK